MAGKFTTILDVQKLIKQRQAAGASLSGPEVDDAILMLIESITNVSQVAGEAHDAAAGAGTAVKTLQDVAQKFEEKLKAAGILS